MYGRLCIVSLYYLFTFTKLLAIYKSQITTNKTNWYMTDVCRVQTWLLRWPAVVVSVDWGHPQRRLWTVTGWWSGQARPVWLNMAGERRSDAVVQCFYSPAALPSMQSAVIHTAIPSVRPSVRPSVCLSVCLSHAGTLSRRMNIGSRGLDCKVAKTL